MYNKGKWENSESTEIWEDPKILSCQARRARRNQDVNTNERICFLITESFDGSGGQL
jgi:hypothetical protein